MIDAQGISYLPYADGSWKHMISAPTFLCIPDLSISLLIHRL